MLAHARTRRRWTLKSTNQTDKPIFEQYSNQVLSHGAHSPSRLKCMCHRWRIVPIRQRCLKSFTSKAN